MILMSVKPPKAEVAHGNIHKMQRSASGKTAFAAETSRHQRRFTMEDIAGTYTAVGGSAVIGGGVSAAELKNSKGVTLRVQGRSIRLEFSVDLGGLQLNLK